MPDHAIPAHRARMPADWSEAFAALPMAEPPDHWAAVAARAGRSRRRMTRMLAIAAAVVVAIALPWKLLHEATAPAPRAAQSLATQGDATDRELQTLYAQSAQLEALLAFARDDRVGSGTAEAVSTQLEQQLAGIDAALSQATLSISEQRALWQQRVAALRTLASFESNRRLLSARGERYDGVLVRVD